MKIDRSYSPPPTAAPASKPAKTSESARPASAASEAVTLSDSAKLAAAESSAPLDIARIEEIKQAIAEGRFKINASAIADRLIESARDILDTQKKS